MTKQFKVYGDIVQDYHIVVEAEDSDEAWYKAVASPKKEWQKGVNRKDKIEPYQVEELITE